MKLVFKHITLILVFLHTNLFASEATDKINAMTAMDLLYQTVQRLNPECRIEVEKQKEGEEKTTYERVKILQTQWKDCQAGRVKRKEDLVCEEIELPSCSLPSLAEIEAETTRLKSELSVSQLKQEERDSMLKRLKEVSLNNSAYFKVFGPLAWGEKYQELQNLPTDLMEADVIQLERALATIKAEQAAEKSAKAAKLARIQALKEKGFANLTAEEKIEAQNFLMERL